MKIIGYSVVISLLIVFSILLGGYVTSTLWGWFIVPTFDISELSIKSAIGLNALVTFLSSRFRPHNNLSYAKNLKEKIPLDETLIEAISFTIANALLTLLIGFLVKTFM